MIDTTSFLSCTTAIFNNWTSFQIGVSNGCAGSQTNEKMRLLPQTITQWIINNEGVGCYELEGVIDSIMYEDFHLCIEDDSIRPTCEQILDSLNLCRSGRSSEALHKYQINPNIHRNMPSIQYQDDSDDEEEEEEEDNEAMDTTESCHKPRNEVDEEGWTTVKTGKKKK